MFLGIHDVLDISPEDGEGREPTGRLQHLQPDP